MSPPVTTIVIMSIFVIDLLFQPKIKDLLFKRNDCRSKYNGKKSMGSLPLIFLVVVVLCLTKDGIDTLSDKDRQKAKEFQLK